MAADRTYAWLEDETDRILGLAGDLAVSVNAPDERKEAQHILAILIARLDVVSRLLAYAQYREQAVGNWLGSRESASNKDQTH